MHIEAAAVSASVWAHSRPRSVLESFWCFYEDFWPRVVNAGEKKAWLIKRRLLVTCCDSGRMNLTTGTNPERDLECPWRARSACHFQITLSQAFLESVLKKKEDIISIQFVRSLCERTDRLSYFGHAPRGELWGTGGREGGRGVDKRPFPFTPDCYWPFEPQGNQPKVSAREDLTEHMTDEECSQQQH